MKKIGVAVIGTGAVSAIHVQSYLGTEDCELEEISVATPDDQGEAIFSGSLPLQAKYGNSQSGDGQITLYDEWVDDTSGHWDVYFRAEGTRADGGWIRSQDVKDACVRNGAVYFIAVGGAAAYLAKCVTAEQTLAYDDLGTEALRRIEVRDFPVFVGIDARGNDVYDLR